MVTHFSLTFIESSKMAIVWSISTFIEKTQKRARGPTTPRQFVGTPLVARLPSRSKLYDTVCVMKLAGPVFLTICWSILAKGAIVWSVTLSGGTLLLVENYSNSRRVVV